VTKPTEWCRVLVWTSMATAQEMVAGRWNPAESAPPMFAFIDPAVAERYPDSPRSIRALVELEIDARLMPLVQSSAGAPMVDRVPLSQRTLASGRNARIVRSRDPLL
jgi:hypothetical protein